MTALSARDQILAVAGALFFQHGYRAIGVDMIIAEAGVAKATLYRHFPSKDDLIVAYLEDANERFWQWFNEAVASAPTAHPRDQLLAIFQRLQKLVTTPTCWGCPFLIAASEFPDRDHPGHRVAIANKAALRARLLELSEQLAANQPEALANQLYLMMDGAFMSVRMFGIDNPAANISRQAAAAIDCATR